MSALEGQEDFDKSDNWKHYIADNAGNYQEVTAKHDGGDVEAPNIRSTNSLILDNNISLQGENVGGAARILARVNVSNETEYSQAGVNNVFLGSGTEFTHDITIEAATPDIELKNTAETTSGLYIFDSVTTSQYGRVLFDASGDEMIINTSSLLSIQRAGFDRLVIDSGTTKVAANDFEVTSGRTFLSRAATNDVSLRVDATNSSFASAASQIRVPNRTNSTAYSFLVCDNSSGRAANLRGNGDLLLDGSVSSPAADQAEMMEWVDGNPDGEDRIGMTVAVAPNEHGKPMIKIAEAGDRVIGVVRAEGLCGLVGNTDWTGWQGRWKKDAHGRVITEDVPMVRWTTEEVREPEWHQPLQKRISQIEKSEDFLTDDEGLCREIEAHAEEHRQYHADLRHWQHQLKRVEVMASEEKTAEAKANVDRIANEMSLLKAQIALKQNQCDKTLVIRANHRRMVDSLVPKATWPVITEEFSYRVDELPADVVVPADAIYWTDKVPVHNPAYDPLREHDTRGDRKEWDWIGIKGIVTINHGQETNDSWVEFGIVAPGISRWFL